jgi:succinate dehydrogenase / fumarate reductase, cytochrome b subunit
MNWFTQTTASSIGRKVIVAFSGLFLVLFLLGHVSGNLLLFKDDGGQAFNEYARFMTTNQFVQVLSIVTYASILLHIIYTIILTVQNRKARPIGYAVSNAGDNSPWTSRNMGILGTLILIFLVIHLRAFWFRMHWGEIPYVNYEGVGEIKNLYAVVTEAFSHLWYVALYVISMLILAFHLTHGFRSAFQTLGLRHKKYTPAIETLGYFIAVVVPILFALMPIYMYFKG